MENDCGEAIVYLETYNYHRSIVTDRLVTQMQSQGIEVYYPKFLLKRPAYPYNLYAEFLTNFRPKAYMLVKDLYKLHVDNICMHPDRSFYALENNKDIIFSNKNMYFSEIQRLSVTYISGACRSRCYCRFTRSFSVLC